MNKIRMIALAACMAATLDAAAQEQEIRLFSHRGGRMEHDENTFSAFQASYDAGYRGFETDIRMTRDGALVITHDSSLERTTNGTGTVEEKTEAEIRQLATKQVDLLLITSKPCNDETIDLCKAMGIKRMGATMDGTSRKAVKKAHKEGLTVILWPGQSVEDFMLGAYLGCDYMCTDVPIEVKGWLAEKAPWIKVKY